MGANGDPVVGNQVVDDQVDLVDVDPAEIRQVEQLPKSKRDGFEVMLNRE